MRKDLGVPLTLGEFRQLTKYLPDSAHFGFFNQPVQKLRVDESNGQIFVSFQEMSVEEVMDDHERKNI